MKKVLILLILFSSIILISNQAVAQNKLKLELGYNASIPVGSFKNDFINKTSYKGALGEVSYSFNPKFSLGLQSGFQNYYQRYDRQLYTLKDGQTISAVVTNTLGVTPLLLRGTFYPAVASKVQPYISGGAGINLVTYGQYLGEFGGTSTSAPLALQAGAGIRIPFGKLENQTAFKLGASYNYVNYNKNDISGLNNIGVNAGVIFRLK